MVIWLRGMKGNIWHRGWCIIAYGFIRQYGVGDGKVMWFRGLKGNVAHRMVW